MQGALLQRESEFGAYLVWNGGTYACSPSALSNAKKLSDGGYSANDDAILTVRAELFSTLPAEKQYVNYYASPTAAVRQLKIESVVIPPGVNYIEMHCNARFQNA